MTTILVTAPDGHVGSTLVPLLRSQGVTVRTLPVRGAAVPDPATLADALAGVDAVHLACGNLPGQVDYETAVIDAAARAGVRRIVKLSARGAEIGSPVAFWHWHAAIEEHLASSGVPWTVLRPSYFMTNLLEAADTVRHTGMLFAPSGSARISMIDPRDVAAVAAVALTASGLEGTTQVLTGPAAVTYDHVAGELSSATGREIGYLDVPPEAARSALTDAGLPAFVAEQIVNVFAALRGGSQDATTDLVHALTGRRARPLASFVREHASRFGDVLSSLDS